MQEDCRCSVCKEETTNNDLNPLSGMNENVCFSCLDQLWEQVQDVPQED